MKHTSKLYLTWDDIVDVVDYIYSYSSILAAHKQQTISGVYGLPRGGLVLAVLVSHKLEVPLLSAPADNCIIIDDICDSGESLSHYISNSSNSVSSKNYHIATAVIRKDCKYIDNIIYRDIVDPGVWVVFPWEV